MADKIITLGKKGTLAAKRRAFAVLCDHGLVSELFSKIAPAFANRQGGYTRIIKLAVNRQGDNAERAILELTEKIVKEPSTTEAKVSGKKVSDKKAEDAVIVAEKKPLLKKAAPAKKEPAKKAKKA